MRNKLGSGQAYHCRVSRPERLGVAGPGRRYDLPKVIRYWYPHGFSLTGLRSGVSGDLIRAAFLLASEYIPIPFKRTYVRDSALITVENGTVGQFDGAGGTLAEAEVLSLYEPDQRGIWFDPDELWVTSGAGVDQTYVLPVLCHEIGHAVGFGHMKTAGHLMSPVYDPMVVTPTTKELKAFRKAYPELFKS